jgi:hypothetical protein
VTRLRTGYRRVSKVQILGGKRKDSQPAKRVATKDIEIIREVNIVSEGWDPPCKDETDGGRK